MTQKMQTKVKENIPMGPGCTMRCWARWKLRSSPLVRPLGKEMIRGWMSQPFSRFGRRWLRNQKLTPKISVCIIWIPSGLFFGALTPNLVTTWNLTASHSKISVSQFQVPRMEAVNWNSLLRFPYFETLPTSRRARSWPCPSLTTLTSECSIWVSIMCTVGHGTQEEPTRLAPWSWSASIMDKFLCGSQPSDFWGNDAKQMSIHALHCIPCIISC